MNTTTTATVEKSYSSHSKQNMQGSYAKFFAMIGTSIVVMFFMMYLHSYQILEHARFSDTRAYMALIMGAAMMVVMLAFMLNMYKNRRANIAIFLSAILLFGASLWLVRSQVFVNDVDWMEGMIPHHSIAILTSERAQIDDVRVQELATEIIEAQRREISEMDWLIADIRENGIAATPAEAEARPLPEFSSQSE